MELAPEVTPNSPSSSPADHTQVARVRKSPQRSRVGNGSAWLTGIDQRSAWYRRFKDCIHEYLSDIPDPSAAERSIIRRVSTLEVELERLEAKFAKAGEASPEDLDLYQRTAGNLRRLLEALGLQRRPRDVTPSLNEYLAGLPKETPP
jgi:hypothetical protein